MSCDLIYNYNQLRVKFVSKKILTLALYFLDMRVYRFLFRVHEFSIYWKFLGENEGDKSVDCKDSSRKFTWS